MYKCGAGGGSRVRGAGTLDPPRRHPPGSGAVTVKRSMFVRGRCVCTTTKRFFLPASWKMTVGRDSEILDAQDIIFDVDLLEPREPSASHAYFTQNGCRNQHFARFTRLHEKHGPASASFIFSTQLEIYCATAGKGELGPICS